MQLIHVIFLVSIPLNCHESAPLNHSFKNRNDAKAAKCGKI